MENYTDNEVNSLINEYIDVLTKTYDDGLLVEFKDQYTNTPEILYHYTSSSGICGILSGNSFWCSNASYFNDYTELKYANSIFNEVKDSKKKGYNNNLYNEVLDRIINIYDGLFDAYVLSLTENGDLLSQWRGYGDKGYGYSIGIKFKDEKQNIIFKTGLDIIIRKVIYCPEKQRSLISNVLDSTYSTIQEILKLIGTFYNEKIRNKIIEEFSLALCLTLADLSLCFKHPTFSEEKEWRIIYSIPNKEINLDYLNFRTRQGNIIPYVNLLVYDSDNKSKDKLPLSKIVFGPALEKELTYKSLRLLLNKYKYEGVIIEQSKVPYKD